MKRVQLLILIIALMQPLLAQHFEVGHLTITFNDPLRSGGFGSGGGPGRQIQCEVYYPSLAGGENSTPAPGSYPFIVFGHGFLMAWDAYRNLTDSIVARGYIMVFPRTESGMSPDHQAFADDLTSCSAGMKEAGRAAGGLLYGVVADRFAFMGHSMGGGAAFLAASGAAGASAVIGLAPAETSPPASLAAGLVDCPALVLSGSRDGVTTPVAHHLPIFEGLSSRCKYLVSITGGGHCYFAGPSMPCDFGEMLASSDITLTRESQQAITMDYVARWIDGHLKDRADSLNAFNKLLVTDTRITFVGVCSVSARQAPESASGLPVVYPNPAGDFIRVDWPSCGESYAWRIVTATGTIAAQGLSGGKSFTIDSSSIVAGNYVLILSSSKGEVSLSLIISH